MDAVARAQLRGGKPVLSDPNGHASRPENVQIPAGIGRDVEAFSSCTAERAHTFNGGAPRDDG